MAQRNRGIALVLVILIAVLIGCVFGSVGVWNYIEILRSRKDDYTHKAMDNALFALGLAVEKLQRLSGRDTCLTAFAGSVLNADDCKRYYTGVWDISSETPAKPNFIGWLVSDEDALTFNSSGETKMRDAVKIFSSGDAADVYISPVRVANDPKIALQYGFWISDESQKIKINLIDRYAKSADFRAEKIRHCCPQTFGREIIFGENSSMANNFILTKIDFPEQLLSLDASAFENFYKNKHAFTLHSYGILSDSRRGGLKRDLSQLTRASPNNAEELLFERRSDLPAYVPTLELLLSFCNLSKEYSENQLPVIATNPMFRPQIFRDYAGSTADYPGEDLQLATIHGIYPTLVQANLNIGLAAINGNFAITFIPQIAIWNPHTADLQTANYSVELRVPDANANNYTTSLTLQGFSDALQSYVKLGTFPLVYSDEQTNMSKILRLNFTTPMRAGEMRIFSLQSSQPIDIANGNTLGNVDSLSNFIHMDTGISAAGYSLAKLSCTNESGAINLHWNCFSWQLLSAQNRKILQEIAELDPLGDEILECERQISAKNSNCFSFHSRMKYGISVDASGILGVRWLANCNPRAQYISRNTCGEYSSLLGLNQAAGNWNFQTHIADLPTPAKLDSAMLSYLNGLILFDVPESTCGVLSVGHLRHVNFLPFGYFPSQILGNSRAHPQIPLNKTFQENASALWPSRGRVESLYDYSYLLNEALFDGYFISTSGTDRDGVKSLGDLINRRFKLLNSESADQNLAAVLLVNGAFNANSHSSLAWKCLLSSVKNTRGEVIFPKFYSEATIHQFPSFDERQVGRLAEKISQLIRENPNPFSTVGNFANRIISSNAADCTRVGTLQRAIDESGINANLEKTFINSQKNIPSYDDISASGYLEENLPNVVNQGDILQLTSHFLCARGDTFLVRAFGDHLGSSGDVLGRAYCEAIVQRVPEYVNDNENMPGDGLDNLSNTNKKFGRRYKIILFRWLDEDKI
ncbi:MAG: hypothetical protein LBI56_02315 [Puniceicoccales bacterium]|jgi:hypothetical protein|nr:hypothetical protein [Puniceicoccales bacterium]